MGDPNGITLLLNVALVTSAKETYKASIPVARPTQPPAVRHAAPIPRSAAASRKNVIQRRRNTLQTPKLERKVGIHMYSVNTPHSNSVTPMALAAGALSQPAPTVQSRNAYHHQKRPYEVNATVPNVLPFLNSRIPAMIWPMPPYANASGTTTAVRLGPSPCSRPALMELNRTVVSPKPASPKGAGFALRDIASLDIWFLPPHADSDFA